MSSIGATCFGLLPVADRSSPLHVQKGRLRYDRFVAARRPSLPPLGGRVTVTLCQIPHWGSASDLVSRPRVASREGGEAVQEGGRSSGRPIVFARRNAAIASSEAGASIGTPNRPSHLSSSGLTVASASSRAAGCARLSTVAESAGLGLAHRHVHRMSVEVLDRRAKIGNQKRAEICRYALANQDALNNDVGHIVRQRVGRDLPAAYAQPVGKVLAISPARYFAVR